MSEKRKSSGAGKGDKRRPFNYKKYNENFEEIEWDSIPRCYNCGIGINRENLEKFPEKYAVYEDGEIEHKNCNFN